jgi:SAM-dependent methyltransferase
MTVAAVARPRKSWHVAAAPAHCRLCAADLERTVVDLGATPLANAFVTSVQAALGLDRVWPLHMRVCDCCLLAQVDTVVPAESIFAEYAYFSSVSSGWVEHARRYAEAMTRRFALHETSLVLEIASIDGYLLQHFIAGGIPVLGIEPAGNIAAVARARGIPTETTFFGAVTARAFAARGVRADLIVANNVLAHVPDIAGFVAGITLVLAPSGVATFEFPHLLRLLEDVQFDTIYHEHYYYLSLLVVERLLAGAGLRAFDVEPLSTHGGSLRVFACHADAAFIEQPGVAAARDGEHAAGLDGPMAYDGFAARVARSQQNIRAFLAARKAAGGRVAAYGAAAKGSTLLNTCGITSADITCVADRSHIKQGRRMPGCHIPIVAPQTLLRERPDNVLILAWNIADEITRELARLRETGTRFWVAIPTLREV